MNAVFYVCLRFIVIIIFFFLLVLLSWLQFKGFLGEAIMQYGTRFCIHVSMSRFFWKCVQANDLTI